jgi:hypothetical protein
MGRARRLIEGAFSKLDEMFTRMDADAVAKLSPAERERYDAWAERTAAARSGASAEELGDGRLVGKVLHGPAGEVVHGIAKAPEGRDPIEDPDAWERQRELERAARDEARAPHLSPARLPVCITRIATRPGTQVREVAEYLGSSGLAARPELVFGAYRVPDVISPGRLAGEPIVEWDIVHAAEAALPPSRPASVLSLGARDLLVLRAPGKPSPLDEDVAIDVLARAGVGPERVLAIARDVSIARTGGDDGHPLRIQATVTGVHVLTAPGTELGTAGAPWRLAEGPPAGVVVEVLQWDAIAVAVHPVRQHRAPLPSPFAYLPLTPQELLTGYLEIVGVSPADAYGAQVTYDRPFDLMSRTSMRSGVRRTGGGPDLPCADGTPRPRMAGGHHIVVAYRDRPEYAAGRQRFDAYMDAVLHAHLRGGTNLRVAVPKPQGRLTKTLERTADVVDYFTGDMGAEDGFVPPRYCWPPRG